MYLCVMRHILCKGTAILQYGAAKGWKIVTIQQKQLIRDTLNTLVGPQETVSPLVRTYQHWYRIIAHRFRNKDIANNVDEFTTLT